MRALTFFDRSPTPAARARALALAVATATATAACTQGTLTLPQPPQDITDVVQAYAMPTGTVDPATVQSIASGAQAELESRNLDWLPLLVTRSLESVTGRFNASVFPTNPNVLGPNRRPRLEAFANVQANCLGWGVPTTDGGAAVGPDGGTVDAGAASPDAGANGSVELTAVVSDTQLQRNVFGTASSCMSQLSVSDRVGLSVNAFLNGSVGVFLQGSLPASDQDAQFVAVFNGQLGTENNIANASVDFRVVNSTVEFRHQVSDGFVIVAIGTQTVTIRAANGTFVCDFSGLNCTSG
jgi:hypothetical protein